MKNLLLRGLGVALFVLFVVVGLAVVNPKNTETQVARITDPVFETGESVEGPNPFQISAFAPESDIVADSVIEYSDEIEGPGQPVVLDEFYLASMDKQFNLLARQVNVSLDSAEARQHFQTEVSKLSVDYKKHVLAFVKSKREITNQ